MKWSRTKSNTEDLMVKVLMQQKKPMSLLEIVDEINRIDPTVFTGKTPRNSLYSVIYRRGKRREEKGEKALFRTIEERSEILYMLNI